MQCLKIIISLTKYAAALNLRFKIYDYKFYCLKFKTTIDFRRKIFFWRIKKYKINIQVSIRI